MKNFKPRVLFAWVVFCLMSVSQAKESIMVMEAYSGKVLLAQNSSQKKPVAGLTKIAAAAVALDWASATGTDISTYELSVPAMVNLIGGPNPLELRPGDHLTIRNALYAMLLANDNRAALTLANDVGRQLLVARAKRGEPVAEFVGEMNRLAEALGMDRTRFGNPHGLEREGVNAYSTAVDMARLSVYAMRINALNFIVQQPSRHIEIQGINGTRRYHIRNSNRLIGKDEIVGIKTASSAGAGSCIALCAHRKPLIRQKPDGSKGVTPRRLIVVILDCPDSFQRAKDMVRRGWEVYDAWLRRGAPVQDPEREMIAVPNPV